MRLTDHYNFHSVREPDIGPPNQEPKKLDDTGSWVNNSSIRMTLGVWNERYWRERTITGGGSHKRDIRFGPLQSWRQVNRRDHAACAPATKFYGSEVNRDESRVTA